MALQSYDDFIARIGAGYRGTVTGYSDLNVSTTGPAGLSPAFQSLAAFEPLPSLPAGVTAYIPTYWVFYAHIVGVTGAPLLAQVIDLGKITLDASAGGVFTDGSAMPSVTECGVSRQVPTPMLIEVTTTLSATPGSLTVTFTDQDGNSGNSIAIGLTASAAIGSTNLINLTAPDTGLVDITNIVRSGSSTAGGVVQFWGLIPIAIVSAGNDGIGQAAPLLKDFNPIRLGAGDVMRVFNMADVTAGKANFSVVHLVGDN